MNPIEKYLRSNPKIASIIYFSTLGFIVLTIYSDIISTEPILYIPDEIDTLVFFFFLYITYIAIMIQKDKKEIKMTTPVTQTEKNGNMTMQFYIPAEFDESNVPDPNNSEVKVLNIKGGYYAAIIYSGSASDSNYVKHKDILEDQLKRDKISIISKPIRATYNSPFTLPMLRRNEVMFKIETNT